MKEFLADCLSHVAKFDSITNILITNEDKVTIASAMAGDKSVMVTATAPRIDTFDTPACLGNLKYLAKVMSIHQIRNHQGVAEPRTGPSTDGSQIIQEISFKGPRVSVTYQATDPKVISAKRPNLKKMDWVIKCKVEPTHSKEFQDAADLLKIADAKADSFAIETDGGELLFMFGEKTHKSVLKIGPVDGEIKAAIPFSITKVRAAMQLMAENGGGALDISPAMVQFWFKSGHADYMVVIPKRLIS